MGIGEIDCDFESKDGDGDARPILIIRVSFHKQYILGVSFECKQMMIVPQRSYASFSVVFEIHQSTQFLLSEPLVKL